MQSEYITEILEMSAYAPEDAEFENDVVNGAIENLMTYLEAFEKESPKLEEYIDKYIYLNMNKKDEKHPGYDSYSTEEYHEFIREIFEQNGMKGIGNLDMQSKPKLTACLNRLSQSANCSERELIFVYAFGLNMELEAVSILLTKVLLQPDFNFKSYKEVIYYWCIKNEYGANRYRKLMELLEYYNEINNFTPYAMGIRPINENEGTQLLQHRVYDLKNEEDLKKYLIAMKKSSINNVQDKSRTLLDEYRKLIDDVYKLFIDGLGAVEISGFINNIKDDDFGGNGKDIYKELNNSGYTDKEGGKYKRLEEMLNNRIQNVNLKKLEYQLPNQNVARNLFHDVKITFKTLRNRLLDENVSVSRKDMLAAIFLKENLEANIGIQDINHLLMFTDFEQEVFWVLKRCNMHPLYLRNPFELFLTICMLQKNPLEYFFATWKKALADE